MTEVSPMRLEMCCARKSRDHSRCPNRIGSSYVEQLGTTRSLVISIDAWSRMGTDAQFHALDQGRETVDGRPVDVNFVEEEIFMNQPEGFTAVGEEQKVCRLQSSIYGLKQASQSWNTCFDEVIRDYDFIKNDYDPCIYKKISGSSIAYLALYVDDILLIENDVKMLGDIKA
ncbi:UNVERIFIED_CONTAM: hypothetical protein Slati_3457300 [Sesamum latifolium]|uniref:Reverse transcriptase Ty1/copia-type domain-containing protein n=1 Tax=Sesamum latifolium TaxID=2727402 RepID=A0AAW2UGZ7_9LAMI